MPQITTRDPEQASPRPQEAFAYLAGQLVDALTRAFAKPDLAGRPIGPEGISMQQMRSLASDPGAMPGLGGLVSRFPKAMAAQRTFPLGGKEFAEQAYPFTLPVRVHYDTGLGGIGSSDSWIDAVKGMNPGHALARARENWPGAVIEVIEPLP